MATPVKERIKTELNQVKVEGKERATRISDILKSAASKTLEEIKEGSTELHVSARKSVAEILEELNEGTETEDAPANTATQATEAEAAIPSWRAILNAAVTVVRDRRGDWLQNLRRNWSTNAAKADEEMTAKYGDRYAQAKTVLQALVERMKAAQTRAGATHSADSCDPAQPVTIEVVDGDTPPDAKAVQVIEPDA
ncbi:MAG: hypothetical protein ACFBSG_17840 [Leptolyngbyaceae cyanobacterium]